MKALWCFRVFRTAPLTQHDIQIRLESSYNEHNFIFFYLSLMKCVIMLSVCLFVCM